MGEVSQTTLSHPPQQHQDVYTFNLISGQTHPKMK